MNNRNIETAEIGNDPAYMVLLLAKERGGIFRFPVYIGKAAESATIETLDLSQRAVNTLKRGKMGSTVAEIMRNIDGTESLKKIKGLGSTTAAEILMKIYLYQYSILAEERKIPYLQEVIDINRL